MKYIYNYYEQYTKQNILYKYYLKLYTILMSLELQLSASISTQLLVDIKILAGGMQDKIIIIMIVRNYKNVFIYCIFFIFLFSFSNIWGKSILLVINVWRKRDSDTFDKILKVALKKKKSKILL